MRTAIIFSAIMICHALGYEATEGDIKLYAFALVLAFLADLYVTVRELMRN